MMWRVCTFNNQEYIALRHILFFCMYTELDGNRGSMDTKRIDYMISNLHLHHYHHVMVGPPPHIDCFTLRVTSSLYPPI